MSKQQAILETLLGTAQLNGNQIIANRIRGEILNYTNSQKADGYRRLAQAAAQSSRQGLKAA